MPEESVKDRIKNSCVPNDGNADPTQMLPSQRGLKLASLNINKLTTHIDELRILLTNNDVDILSINETKLDINTSDNEVHIPGYEIIRSIQIVCHTVNRGCMPTTLILHMRIMT